MFRALSPHVSIRSVLYSAKTRRTSVKKTFKQVAINSFFLFFLLSKLSPFLYGWLLHDDSPSLVLNSTTTRCKLAKLIFLRNVEVTRKTSGVDFRGWVSDSLLNKNAFELLETLALTLLIAHIFFFFGGSSSPGLHSVAPLAHSSLLLLLVYCQKQVIGVRPLSAPHSALPQINPSDSFTTLLITYCAVMWSQQNAAGRRWISSAEAAAADTAELKKKKITSEVSFFKPPSN